MKDRFTTSLIGTVLVLEGCSSVSVPSPKPSTDSSETPGTSLSVPIDNIVNCQTGPFKGQASYDLKKGAIKDVGGITSAGQEEDIVILSLGNANINPLVSTDITVDSQTELIFHSKYLKYRITQGVGTDSGSKGEIFMECNNFAHNG